jgi:putative spermidine/putrescine transport system ATP-binding protein
VHVRTPERVAPGDRLRLSVDPGRALIFPHAGDDAARAGGAPKPGDAG